MLIVKNVDSEGIKLEIVHYRGHAYHCGQLGHMVRDCPGRSADTTFVGGASGNRAQSNNPQRDRGSRTQDRVFVMNR